MISRFCFLEPFRPTDFLDWSASCLCPHDFMMYPSDCLIFLSLLLSRLSHVCVSPWLRFFNPMFLFTCFDASNRDGGPVLICWRGCIDVACQYICLEHWSLHFFLGPYAKCLPHHDAMATRPHFWSLHGPSPGEGCLAKMGSFSIWGNQMGSLHQLKSAWEIWKFGSV